ncbi:UNVERIFIED_CONTAM: hypothetical protein RMT77_017603 [Armadillidium vulgare]
MDIKSEIEIKMEELVSENDFSQDHQKFVSLKNVSSLLNKVNEKGLKAHFESDEEEYFAQILTSKFPLLLLKKWSYKELKSLMINAAEGEKDLEVKSTSKSKPQRAKVHQQSIREYHLEDLCCRYCNFSFKSKDELKTHLKTHKRKFKCAHCSYESNLKSVLKRHMLTHSNIKLYKCYDCSFECNQIANLKSHLLTHANVKLFKCSDCSYECKRKGELKSHMLTHTNVNLFKCSDCSYECNRKRDLNRHMLTHTNANKCSDCSYECNRKDNLKTHMLIHTNVKLFKCSDCSYECKRKGELKSHMLTHTNVKLFKCSDCSYECNRKGDLKTHMLTHRNVICKTIHFKLCKKYNITTEAQNYWKHNPPEIVENNQALILYDCPIPTDIRVAHNRPDIVIKDKTERKMLHNRGGSAVR